MADIIVDVQRTELNDESEESYQRFLVPSDHRMNVVSVLQFIRENLDPTFVYRTYRCTRGICNSCRVRLNGRVVKACSVPVRPGDHLILEPHNNGNVIRDLVCKDE